MVEHTHEHDSRVKCDGCLEPIAPHPDVVPPKGKKEIHKRRQGAYVALQLDRAEDDYLNSRIGE